MTAEDKPPDGERRPGPDRLKRRRPGGRRQPKQRRMECLSCGAHTFSARCGNCGSSRLRPVS